MTDYFSLVTTVSTDKLTIGRNLKFFLSILCKTESRKRGSGLGLRKDAARLCIRFVLLVRNNRVFRPFCTRFGVHGCAQVLGCGHAVQNVCVLFQCIRISLRSSNTFQYPRMKTGTEYVQKSLC